MSKNESVELDEILERYHRTDWKEAGLEELIKKVQKEIAYWDASYIKRLTNDFTRVIEIAENLAKTKKVVR